MITAYRTAPERPKAPRASWRRRAWAWSRGVFRKIDARDARKIEREPLALAIHVPIQIHIEPSLYAPMSDSDLFVEAARAHAEAAKARDELYVLVALRRAQDERDREAARVAASTKLALEAQARARRHAEEESARRRAEVDRSRRSEDDYQARLRQALCAEPWAPPRGGRGDGTE